MRHGIENLDKIYKKN